MTRRAVTTANDDGLRGSLGVSAGLHLAALLLLYFGLPSLMKPLPTPSMPVPFEIVEIADITNTRVKEQEETPKPPVPQPKPEAKAAPAPPTPPQPPQPEPAKPQPQEQTPAQVEALTPAPVPAKKPTPPAPAKPQQDLLASVLKNVEKMKPAEEVKNPDTQSQTKDKAEAQPKSMAPSLSSRLTISEEDALRRQIEQHWNVPIGARDVENMIVEVHIDVNPDRTVQNVEVVDKSRMTTDPYFRAMAESVVRAIYQSSPLELPEGKYDQWKGIDSHFSAKDML
jgi:outer membrane biosynthesis protein TonB